MAGDTGTTSLGDLCDPDRGITYGIVKVGDFVSDGVPVIRGGDIRNGRIQIDHEKRVSTKVSQQFQRTILRGGELVINLIAEPGHTAIVPPELAGSNVSRDVGVIPLNTSVDHRYVDYCLKSPMAIRWLTSRLQGSVTQKINLATLRDVPIPTPPLAEQRAIAHILGTLDDKIELNRRMSETLEAMARALFKSWFVDFDPVRAKAKGRDPGLPQPLAELFPACLVESELGEIPEGWEVGRFGDVVEQLRDQENPLSFPDVLFHHFSIPAFDEGQTAKAEFGESIKSLKSRVPPGVILISKLNPEIERVWMVDVRPGERTVCSTEFLVLCARPPFTRGYVYCLARSPVFRQQIEGLVTGTSKSHQRAQVESILNLAAVKPPLSIVAAFDRVADGMLARTLECRRDSRMLAAVRDTLLPKLISGDVRVKDTERFVPEGVA